MPEPKTYEEYLDRTKQNTKCDGFGLGQLVMSQPCFFCGAPELAKYTLLDMQQIMSHPHTCSECGRSAKIIFTEDGNTTQFECVQTGGSDQPDFFTHKVRRVDA